MAFKRQRNKQLHFHIGLEHGCVYPMFGIIQIWGRRVLHGLKFGNINCQCGFWVIGKPFIS